MKIRHSFLTVGLFLLGNVLSAQSTVPTEKVTPTPTTEKKEPTWLDQHAGEPGFGTVTQFCLSLAEIQYHAFSENPDFKEWGVDTGLALKQLYELSPQKAVWVSKFWRLKARISEQGYLNDMVEKYSKKDHTNDQDKQFEEDLEDAFRGYYYDHWKEIESMISFNIDMAVKEHREQATADKSK